MISWTQKVLQKHYKWLFSIMLVIIIIAFVFTIGGSPGIGHSQVSSKKQIYYGINLNNEEEIRELFRNANISHILNTGESFKNKNMAESLALTRPALLSLAKKLQVPNLNEFELTEYIKTRPLFLNDEGNFDPQKYQEFIAQVKSDKNLNEHIVREVLSQDKRIDQVSGLLGGPGYALPFEAQHILAQQKTVWSIDLATLDIKDLDANLNIPEDKLEEHYKTNKLAFTVPTQIEVAYALFPAEKYMAKVPTPSDEELEEFKKSESKTDSEELKPKVLEEYKKHQAERLAAEAANNFQIELHNNNIPFNSEEFKNLLKKYNISLSHLPAFNTKSLPKGTPVPDQLLRESTKLNPTHYYSDVATTHQGAFMLFFKKEIPPFTPPLEEIKQKLTEHYLANESLRLLESKSRILDKTLSSAVKSDKSFKKVAKEEGLKVVSFEKFKMTEPPKDLPKLLLSDIQKLGKGQLSGPIMRDDRIYFIYVTDRETPTIDENDPEIKSFYDNLEQFTSLARSYAITNELITQGIAESEKK
ncbi:MAG: hypothetical protein C5B43_01180 [Verrucomicrobia bacterium]|nr:MAG: hypothetical protein C5B43_01180 [Verrucomicrobiota bacterium]